VLEPEVPAFPGPYHSRQFSVKVAPALFFGSSSFYLFLLQLIHKTNLPCQLKRLSQQIFKGFLA
jgi:hypothetical protein